jgi:hypothetical protein
MKKIVDKLQWNFKKYQNMHTRIIINLISDSNIKIHKL